MFLLSPDFSDQGKIPVRFTCDGDDISPAFEWSDVPAGTVELAMICEDPDAPGRTFVHWVVWGIDPASSGVEAATIPDGWHQGRNDFGANAYGGPCPPPGHGVHHYGFTLYAVGKTISLPDGASIEQLRDELQGETLAEATVTGTFER